MIDLKAIRAAAEAAPKDILHVRHDFGVYFSLRQFPGDYYQGRVRGKERANFIATANPATVIALCDEIERLTACLKKANDQAEHFEREWYLRGDRLEAAEKALAEPAVEPVGKHCMPHGWVINWPHPDGGPRPVYHPSSLQPKFGNDMKPNMYPVYTSPPPPAEVPPVGLCEKICAAIKAADDKSMEADYMLDSEDCIRVVREFFASPPPPAGPVSELESVLCDPSSKCSIKGSDADRAIVDAALSALRNEVAGCFEMALGEGLAEALAETTDERLKDLVERRLMFALYAAQEAPPPAEPAKKGLFVDLIAQHPGLSEELAAIVVDAPPAEPAVEPVAWWVVNKTTDEKFATTRPDDWNNLNWLKYPLFTSPPPPAEPARTSQDVCTVPLLSDEEVAQCIKDASKGSAINRDGSTSQRIVRSAEQLVRRKAGL